ncbi:hypothetical protein [Natronomonas sp.]|uniref:hypothetical protein n=1 Tax=Natronomonas sp. TaxID=2184060 RepID=UPI002FC2880A
MDLRAWLASPLARAVLWLPAATLAVLAILDSLSLVAFGNGVLVVTLLAAIGWVTVGLGGSRVEGPLETAARPTHAEELEIESGPSTFAGLLTFLTVTAVVGWALLLLAGI